VSVMIVDCGPLMLQYPQTCQKAFYTTTTGAMRKRIESSLTDKHINPGIKQTFGSILSPPPPPHTYTHMQSNPCQQHTTAP